MCNKHIVKFKINLSLDRFESLCSLYSDGEIANDSVRMLQRHNIKMMVHQVLATPVNDPKVKDSLADVLAVEVRFRVWRLGHQPEPQHPRSVLL